MFKNWWQYQKERFPLGPYVILIASICYAASATAEFSWTAYLLVFIQIFCTFALLRIVDEFKDYQEDCTHRPYRPVPRGLVSLRQLGILGVALVFVQWALAWPLGNGFYLLLWWLYFILMSFEFFVSKFLKSQPLLYLISHMLIMFLFAAFLARAFGPLSDSYIEFALLNFVTGLLLEIGRKIRLGDEEEEGVDSYSKLWGRPGAIKIWYTLCLIISVLLAKNSLLASGIFTLLSIATVIVFLRPISVKIFEAVSSLWLLAAFIAWGALL